MSASTKFTPTTPLPLPAALPQVMVYGQPGLRQLSQTIPVDFPKEDNPSKQQLGLWSIIQTMVNVLASIQAGGTTSPGGLAAPQINLSLLYPPAPNIRAVSLLLRVFVLPPGKVSKRDKYYREFINPVILNLDVANASCGDGCLSVPEASSNPTNPKAPPYIAGPSTFRSRSVTVEYSTFDNFPNGPRTTATFSCSDGTDAWFLVQHEIDHLNGKLYCDFFGPTTFAVNLDNIASGGFPQPTYLTYPAGFVNAVST